MPDTPITDIAVLVTPGSDRNIKFNYFNWRGDFGTRRVTPERVWWGATKHHPVAQWIMSGFDHDKGANRDFALADCDFSNAKPVQSGKA